MTEADQILLLRAQVDVYRNIIDNVRGLAAHAHAPEVVRFIDRALAMVKTVEQAE